MRNLALFTLLYGGLRIAEAFKSELQCFAAARFLGDKTKQRKNGSGFANS